jgi:hypothetical protein
MFCLKIKQMKITRRGANGMGCCRETRMPAQKVLANPVVQVPYVRPGYVPRGQETP